MRKSWSALTLGLVLVACGQQPTGPSGVDSIPGPDPKPNPAPGLSTVRGNVVTPAPLASAGVQAQSLPEAGALLAQAAWSAPRVPGQLLVLDAPAGSLGAQGLGALSALNPQRLTDSLSVIRTPAGESDQALAARLAAAGVRVQPNYVYKAQALPNDPGVPGNAGITAKELFSDRTYKAVQTYLTTIRAPQAWDFLQSSQKSLNGVNVAVLDTGFNANHPDLVNRVLAAVDCSVVTGGKCSGGNLADTNDDHGTPIAGILGAETNNEQGVAGLTWKTKNIILVKVFDDQQNSPTTATIAAGIGEAISRKARVINMSLGGQQDAFSDQVVQRAIQDAANNNIAMFAAAGNYARGAGSKPIVYPASDPNVVAVGSVGPDNTLAYYSASGADIVAPGGEGDCGRASCDNVLMLSKSGGYVLNAGTSEATPMVAGAAALVLGANPNLSARQVEDLLVQTASSVSGGRLLNVEAAVKAALGSTPPPPPPANTYTLTVQAVQGGTVKATYQEKVQGGSKAYPYELNIPNGTYTLKATISGPKNYSGSRDQTVQADVNGVDIAVK